MIENICKADARERSEARWNNKRAKRVQTKTLRGQAETPFVLFLAIVFSVLVFLGGLMASTYPNAFAIQQWDILVYGGTFIGVAGACAVATGLPCAAALILANIITLISTSNTLLYTLVFLPLTITLAYVIARLARGGG